MIGSQCAPMIPIATQHHYHTPQDPNPEDPLNKEAAESLLKNASQFEQTIQRHILRGTHIGNTYWPPCAS